MVTTAELLSLAGEIALVTGASRGIGAGIADALGGAGATVIGTATTAPGAAGITARLKGLGIAGRGLILDASSADSVAAAEKDIAAHEGQISILVNNAGITRDNLLLRMKDEEWDAVIATNLSSVYLTSKTFVRGMLKKRHGRIINISSVIGAMGNAGQANYAAAKAGIAGFSKSLAREVGSRGITVNVVAPGFIQTDMTSALPEEQRAKLAAQIPLQRLGAVDDVAGAVLFLASRAGGYVTGETLHVNGGLLMT
ncbi:MAG: 3-oxoacyl-ACP reductase FabG [Gammaproteobacteria bacterium]|nr:3-oxoacyl-ACP reductase FabG [Gammaproteobacteria bacterium]MDH5275428.1 3-oxoacyl-ACP reductase FabG [Gammaproteobacteria bacterium]